ncbi:DUF262 domain-containing protein [Helicobacter pylori]
MAEMKPDKKILKKILVVGNDTYYQIPTYQRPYQWGKEQCKELLNDLFENYEDHREDDYFCGSLVFIQSDKDNKTDIVDGQQRLSTFILLAKVLVTLYSERLTEESKDYLQESLNGRYGKKDQLNFNAIGFNSKKDFQYALISFNNAPISNNKNNYLKNAICLKNYLEKKEIADINDFIRWLYLKVIFIKTTCSNISMALRIFSVLNARGLPLHAIDVFKVELLKKLAKEKDQEDFVYRWNALRQKCLDNESKFPKRKENKREKNAAEILFSWYLTYLHPVTSAKNMEERLADQFENLNKTPLEYLKSVEDFYNAYCEVLEMQDRHAHLLSYLASDFWCIILCTSILHNYSQSEKEALKELLVKFYYQYWVAGKTRPTREQTCCNIIKALKEKKSMEHIVSIARNNLDEYSVTQHFKEKLRDDHLYEKYKKGSKSSWLKPVLILVEYFMSDDKHPKRIQTNDFHVEHILPQKPTLSSQWAKDFSEEERERYTHSLANLTLLWSKKNTEASNLDFKDKKKIYMGEEIKLDKKKTFRVMTCYKMTIDIAHNYAEWTPKSLEKREKELIEIIESVLTL